MIQNLFKLYRTAMKLEIEYLTRDYYDRDKVVGLG